MFVYSVNWLLECKRLLNGRNKIFFIEKGKNVMSTGRFNIYILLELLIFESSKGLRLLIFYFCKYPPIKIGG